MKRLNAILLTGSLLVTAFGPLSVYAESMTKATEVIQVETESKLSEKEKKLIDSADISRDEAIKIATEFFTIPKGYKQQSVSFHSNWYMTQGSVWRVEYRSENERAHGNYHITVDAQTGDVLEMNHYQYKTSEESATYPPEVDWDEARKIASDFITAQFTEQAKSIQYDDFFEKNQKTPLHGNVMYDVRFLRTENNVPYNENYISVRVDGNGDIFGFDYRWNPSIIFPETNGMISLEEAMSTIKSSLPLQLQYKRIYDYYMERPNDEKKPLVLAYENQFHYPFLDATTGKWMNYRGETISDDDLKDIGTPIVDKPIKVEQDIEGKELTAEEASKIIEDTFIIPEDVELGDVQYDEYGYENQQAVWRFYWRNDAERFWMNASVNAKTGEIVNYYRDIYYENNDDKDAERLSYDEAKKIAIGNLKELIPGKVHELVFRPNPNYYPNNQQREIHFQFNRIYDGILVADQWVNIAIHAQNGEIVNFNQNIDNEAIFPDSKNVMDKEAAVKAYLERFEVSPKFVNLNHEPYTIQNQEERKNNIALVYELRHKPIDEPLYLDAVKGKWVSMRTGEVIEEQQEAVDISGHWAEEQLELMIEHGAIKVNDDGKVFPNEKISRGEMVKMLMLATNPDPYFYKIQYSLENAQATFKDVANSSQYFPYVELAVQQGLLDKSKEEFNPDDLVTREELADLIVRALRLHELSKIDEMFNLDFKDNDRIEDKGTVAIVKHLEIMNGANGYFYPDQHVTRAEAAKVYFEFLKKRGKYTK